MSDLRAPFPWFGGKSRAAHLAWQALGDVPNYVEPFAGSLAVLLGRPGSHRGTVETVNDLDAYLANFWRALAHDPDEVTKHADWPVNETDLTARHAWLVSPAGRARVERMHADPDHFDAKVAGWWVWGLCCWIGSGWCSGRGPWVTDGETLSKLPHLGNPGQGVNRQLPHLGNPGQGVNRQLPHLGDTGRGVNRKLPHLGDTGREPLLAYMWGLADRLRKVRVCCGDWRRVLTDGAMSHPRGGLVGVFLDPPYADTADRCADVYAQDSLTVAHDVREWALAHGDDERLRIVLAGYEGEHTMPGTWRAVEWKSAGAYSTTRLAQEQDTQAYANRARERLWCSPHCLRPAEQGVLW